MIDWIGKLLKIGKQALAERQLTSERIICPACSAEFICCDVLNNQGKCLSCGAVFVVEQQPSGIT